MRWKGVGWNEALAWCAREAESSRRSGACTLPGPEPAPGSSPMKFVFGTGSPVDRRGRGMTRNRLCSRELGRLDRLASLGVLSWQWKRILRRYEAVLAKLPAMEKWAFELGWREAGHCANADGLAPKGRLHAKTSDLNTETAAAAATPREIPGKKNGIGASTPARHRVTDAPVAGRAAQGDRRMRDQNTEAAARAARSEAPKKKNGVRTRTSRVAKSKERPRAGSESRESARGQQKGEDPRAAPAFRRRDAEGADPGDRMAATFGPQLSLRRSRQKDGPDGRIGEGRERGAPLLGQSLNQNQPWSPVAACKSRGAC